jgi:glycosyltransferase involved in cell wall biosynthesis
MIRKKVLLISSWYPTRLKPTLGNFIFKHAESVAIYHDVYALHVVLDENMVQQYEESFQSIPFPSKVVYIKKSRLPIIGKLVNRIRILIRYNQEFKQLQKDGFNPDLVHAHVVFPVGFIAWYYKVKYKVNYICSEHWTGYHDYTLPRPGFIQRNLIRFFANRALLILPDSYDLGRSMNKWNISTPMHPVANVVNSELFLPTSERVENNKIKIIHISTLDKNHKNINLLLDGFAVFFASEPKAELHIVTDGDFDFYRNRIIELGILDSVFNHGCLDVNGVADALRSSDFFVLTSNWENLPCVLIESISCGVPVISTDVGGVAEIIDDENGLIIPPNNLDALIEAMKQMAVNYKSYNKKEMHRKASEKYSYQAVGLQLAEIYVKYAN